MKLFKAVAAMACAVALSGAAQAATYSDCAANYELNHDLATGDNGGTGFGAWEIEKHGSGDGWAGCGVWDPSANSFQGDWAGKTQAFGIIGKGDSYGVNAYRPFRAPLAVGDSFSLEMGVNWDPNSGIDALKGFALLAKNGTYQALTINHRSNPGNIAINGNVDSEILNAFGTYPMKWTFTAKDESTLTVTATPRDGSETIYEQDWAVETSAIDGFRLQSSGQNAVEVLPPEAIEAGETPQMWADRRQTYFDNFTLELADELPELVDIEFTGGDWYVDAATKHLTFTVKRSSSDGELEVKVKSSFEDFVPATTATFADGEAEATFAVDATLQGAYNEATITVSATGCNPASGIVRGPCYKNSWEGGETWPGDTKNFWMDWEDNGIALDTEKITIESDPAGALTLPDSWTWNMKEEGGAWVESSFVANSSGKLVMKFDGVTMDAQEINVTQPGFTLIGPTSAKTGSTNTYTLKGTFKEPMPATLSATGGATVSPDSFAEIVSGDEYEVTVTFPETAGEVVLSVWESNGEDYRVDLPIAVTAPVDPAIFDDYVAYDDASLYDDGFDFAATGAGQDKFQAWSVFKDSAEYGDAIVTTADGGFPAILTDGKAFAIYANGNDPDYAIYRPFVNDLQPGQKASIEFVVAENPGSALYVQFARVWEGTPYNRFEFWANGSGYGVNVDGAEGTALGWAVKPRRVVASIQLAADGSEYTINLEGYDEGADFVSDIYQHVVKADIGSWGEGIQGIVIGGYNLATDCIFNKLAIEQVEEPVKVRTIGIMGTWNMDATGDYDFAVGPSEAGDPVGTVALAVTPDDGRVVLSAASVDVPGDDVAAFTVTVTSVPGEGEEAVTYTITATPADESIPAADFNLTPIRPNLWLATENWEHSTDEDSIWLSLNATPSFYGTYAITSEDDSILSVPESSASITVDEGQTQAWFDVKIEGPGVAKIFATLGEKVAEYGFTINPGVDPDVELPAPVFVKGKGLAWDASILDNGFVLRGTDTLGESPDKDSWSDLVEGTDYVVEEGQVVVLYTSVYNYIALLKK